MSQLLATVPMFIAFAIHVAVIVTLLSALGVLAGRVTQQLAAPYRHTLQLSILVALILTPAFAAITDWRIGLPAASISSLPSSTVPAAQPEHGGGTIEREVIGAAGVPLCSASRCGPGKLL